MTEIGELRQLIELLEKKVGLMLDVEAEVARQFTQSHEGFDDWLAANRASREAIEELDAARCEYLLAATKVSRLNPSVRWFDRQATPHRII